MCTLVIPKFNIGAIDKNTIASRAFAPSGVNSQLPVTRPLASELFKSAPADLSAFASLLTAIAVNRTAAFFRRGIQKKATLLGVAFKPGLIGISYELPEQRDESK